VRVLLLLAAVPALLATETAVEVSSSLFGASTVAEAQASSQELRVGDTLQAVRDVSLDEAIVAEGSKVNVSGKRSLNGNVLVDVALADGHVVKGLPLAEIHKNFRRVDR
jgi:hypothetical protein